MKIQLIVLLLFSLLSCTATTEEPQEETNQVSAHNFTIQRLLVVNDNNEMLMMAEQSVWAPPSLLYKERQFVKEGLDSLSNAYGIKISTPELRGQFSFKYDYQPYATIRNYYVAKYLSGDIKVPEGMQDAKWLPIHEAIEKNSVTAIKEISEQIIKFPNAVWGGSFLVSHIGDDHPTKIVENFYPLFERKSDH